MVVLYQGGGAGDFELSDFQFDKAALKTLLYNAGKVLRERDQIDAAKLLGSVDFEIWDAYNPFQR